MSDLKNELIKLGATNPELRENIRPILAHMGKTADAGTLVKEKLLDYRAVLKLRSGPLKDDPAGAGMVRPILEELIRQFEVIPTNTYVAINKLQNLALNPGRDADNVRNQLAKISDLLGIKPPHNLY